jgi:hypothetical protein
MYEDYINEVLSVWKLSIKDIQGEITDKWLIYIRCIVCYRMFEKMTVSDKQLAEIFKLPFDVYKKQIKYFKLKQLKKRDTYRGYKYGKDTK